MCNHWIGVGALGVLSFLCYLNSSAWIQFVSEGLRWSAQEHVVFVLLPQFYEDAHRRKTIKFKWNERLKRELSLLICSSCCRVYTCVSAGCLMSAVSDQRGRSGSTASRESRVSFSVWRSVTTTSSWLRMRRWWAMHTLWFLHETAHNKINFSNQVMISGKRHSFFHKTSAV